MAYIDIKYRNRSGRQFKNRTIKPYRALCNFNGRRIWLGQYATLEEARRVEVVERQRYINEWEEEHGRKYPYLSKQKKSSV